LQSTPGNKLQAELCTEPCNVDNAGKCQSDAVEETTSASCDLPNSSGFITGCSGSTNNAMDCAWKGTPYRSANHWNSVTSRAGAGDSSVLDLLVYYPAASFRPPTTYRDVTRTRADSQQQTRYTITAARPPHPVSILPLLCDVT